MASSPVLIPQFPFLHFALLNVPVVILSLSQGIESARHGKFDPQGLVGAGAHVIKDIQEGKNSSGDIFDGVLIVAGDGMIGASEITRPTRTTTVRSLTLKPNKGFSLTKL